MMDDQSRAEERKWEKEFRSLVRSRETVALMLKLSASQGKLKAEEDFACRVPPSFLERMKKGDATDPLLLQVYPQALESLKIEGFSANPLQEKSLEGLPILKKYAGRALWLITQVCAVHCRYCFRRATSFSELEQGAKGTAAVIEALKKIEGLKEVILSGGDPLVLPTASLKSAIEGLQTLSDLQAIRIHTRMPIVIPSRITSELCKIFKASTVPIVIVLHCNHPNELTEEIKLGVRRLKEAGVTLLNQSVLLKGVNDEVDVLCALSEKLFSYGILPYYLHFLDPVEGAAHFHVPMAQAKEVVKGMLSRLPGYWMPKFVQEVPMAASKVAIELSAAL